MTLYDSTKTAIHDFYTSMMGSAMPIATKSEFIEKGTLTPDEFVEAGDKLVNQCRTWTWETGDKDKKKDYFKDKQYLQSRNVPCAIRVADLRQNAKEDIVENGEWLAMDDESIAKVTQKIEYVDLNDTMENKSDNNDKNEMKGIINIVEHMAFNDETKKEDSFEEIETFNDEKNVVSKQKESNNLEKEKKSMDVDNDKPMFKLKQEDDSIIKTRTYDISITYDAYYKVPQVWLRGYDESANPLSSEQIFEDISTDHAHKTVTVKTHPHINAVCVTIHPCRHSQVMKMFMDKSKQNGEEITVQQYMFLFLKFISVVIPTIEYDWTQSVE